MDTPQVSKEETAELLRLAETTLKNGISGDWTEFGCYRGATSVLFGGLLRAQNADKKLYLYDSFAGLPDKTSEDSSSVGDAFKAGELFVTKREVLDRFRRQNLPLPIIKKAFFSDLDPSRDVPEKISFAFLDGDLYSSIKTSLALTAPRLNRQGIIVIHDYNNPSLPGSARAVDEFLHVHKNFRLRIFRSLAVLTQI